jgi:hypothetical protein
MSAIEVFHKLRKPCASFNDCWRRAADPIEVSLSPRSWLIAFINAPQSRGTEYLQSDKPVAALSGGLVGDPPMSVLQAQLEREAGTLSLLVGATRLCPGENLTGLLDSFDDQTVEIALPARDISLRSAGV